MSLTNQPDDIIMRICSFIDLTDVIKLKCTSNRLYNIKYGSTLNANVCLYNYNNISSWTSIEKFMKISTHLSDVKNLNLTFVPKLDYKYHTFCRVTHLNGLRIALSLKKCKNLETLKLIDFDITRNGIYHIMSILKTVPTLKLFDL
jgi:hypothetical protein